jgi:hypothetical protein
MLVLEMGPSASASGSGSIKQRVFDPDTDTDPDPEDPIASSLAASRGHADQGPANGIGLFLCPRLHLPRLHPDCTALRRFLRPTRCRLRFVAKPCRADQGPANEIGLFLCPRLRLIMAHPYSRNRNRYRHRGRFPCFLVDIGPDTDLDLDSNITSRGQTSQTVLWRAVKGTGKQRQDAAGISRCMDE